MNLMKSYPKAVVDHKELVLRCLADDDVTIRTKALELLTGMVTRRNLTELVHKLMQHVLLAEGAYRDEIIQKVIFMCSRDKYAYLSGEEKRRKGFCLQAAGGVRVFGGGVNTADRRQTAHTQHA